jgi:hypothetical protein
MLTLNIILINSKLWLSLEIRDPLEKLVKDKML